MKRLIVAAALGAAVTAGAPVVAQSGSGEDALKATHALLMKAVASANVSMVSAVVHPQALGFFREARGSSSLARA